MMKNSCTTCKYLEMNEASSYCTMRPNWLQFLKNNDCEFYEERREEERTC